MRLSQAILLGDSLRERDPYAWLREEDGGSIVGCALGGATLAVGGTLEDFQDKDTITWLQQYWPWLGGRERRTISGMFVEVFYQKRTLESLVDYVRSIEPECGSCCQFECTCVQPQKAEEVVKETCLTS